MKTQSLEHQHFEVIDSTHLHAKTQCSTLKPFEWRLYTAGTQNQGIGRSNKLWQSPTGGNIYATYSFLIKQEEANKMLYMPQVTCLQVSKLLESLGLKPSIKWVNDVLVNQKKICGILADSLSNATQFNDQIYTAVFISIGLNVDLTTEALSQISQPATSILAETNKKFDTNDLVIKLSKLLMENISVLLSEGFTNFQAEVTKRLERFENKPIIVKKPTGEYVVGVIESLGEQGELILRTAPNICEHLFDGSIIKGDELDNLLTNPDINSKLHETRQ
jgi:BirA family biotin operon repressor/biotin-[acetyl-CoA-carboxylase] ligase